MNRHFAYEMRKRESYRNILLVLQPRSWTVFAADAKAIDQLKSRRLH